MTTPETDMFEILEEEDKPFPPSGSSAGLEDPDKNLVETDDIKKELTRFRFKTGRTVLYVSMMAMGIAVIADILATRFLEVKSDLVTSAFEAFKLITMTVLGYFFASNDSSGN